MSSRITSFMKASIEGIDFAGILPILDTTSDWISNIWPSTVQQALLGQITAEEAMQTLQTGLGENNPFVFIALLLRFRQGNGVAGQTKQPHHKKGGDCPPVSVKSGLEQQNRTPFCPMTAEN